MLRTLVLGLVATGTVALANVASAQYVPHVVYQSPAVVAPAPVVVAPQPTVVYRPLVPAAPQYVAPAPVVVARPVVPAPVVATPVVPTTVVAPTPVTVTRYRPILGGTVTRTYYRYAPIPAVPVY